MVEKIKKQMTWRYGFALLILVGGLILEYFNLGHEFLGFSSVGIWLIYVGFVMLFVITLQFANKKRRVVDERVQFIGMKASRITFLVLILTAFLIMIADGIKTISIPYSLSMSYLVCGVVFVYFISYKILERYN